MAEHRPPRRPRSTGNPDEYRSPMVTRSSEPGQTGAPDEYRSPMSGGASGRARAHDEAETDEAEKIEAEKIEPRPVVAAETADPEDLDEQDGPMPSNTGDPDAYRSPMHTGAVGRGVGGNYRAPMHTGPGRARRGGEYRSPMAAGRAGKASEYRSPMATGRSAEARDARPPQRARPAQKRPMFAITCATCGKAAEVPFKPAEGREVHCQDCFRARKQGQSKQG